MSWSRYTAFAQKYPLRAWALQTAVAMGVGDVISQVLVEKKDWSTLDKKRTARFAAMGLLVVGPTVRLWYVGLDRMMGSGISISSGVKKMLLDQGLFAPLFLGNFFILMGMIQRQPFEKVQEKLKLEYFDVLKANWMVWPLVQTLNFTFVPLGQRITVVNITAICWNTYLAWKFNKTFPQENRPVLSTVPTVAASRDPSN